MEDGFTGRSRPVYQAYGAGHHLSLGLHGCGEGHLVARMKWE
jgi:hypothetical protein